MSQNSKPQGISAYERLRNEILYGELMPGQRLRASELTDRYTLGLTPLREALVRLTSEGLVTSENHRGARVTGVSLAEFHDMMEVRQEIEELCLVRALKRGDAEWEGDILRSFHVLSTAEIPTQDGDFETSSKWEAHHRRFHHALVVACGSDWMMRIWNMLVDHTERYRKLRMLRLSMPQAAVRDVNQEHRRLMDAALSRDVGLITELMRNHLSETDKAVAALFEADPKLLKGIYK